VQLGSVKPLASQPEGLFEPPAGVSWNAPRVNRVCSTKPTRREDLKVNEIDQLASAMLAIAFAVVMLVAGQLFIEYRASRYPVVEPVQTASLPL